MRVLSFHLKKHSKGFTVTNFFRLFYRNLLRNKTFSVIAIAGFTLSLTVVLLLSAFVSYESSYDTFHTNIDSLYRLIQQDGNSDVDEEAITFLQKDYPEIESVCRYNDFGGMVSYQQQALNLKSLFQTEPSFLTLFDIEFLQGDPDLALASKDNILLSDVLAAKLFGQDDPIGEMITYNHELPLKVTAVYRFFPDNSSFQPEAIIHRDTKAMVSMTNNNGKITYYNRFFLKLYPHSDAHFLESKLSADLKAHELAEKGVRLLPFKKSYMYMGTGHSHLKHTNLLLILILGGIALIIVVVSGLNYVILFTATNITRLKEIGLKKTIGASSTQIFAQFLMESVLLCLISFIAAGLAAQLLHPVFENIVGKNFPLSRFLHFSSLLFIVPGVLLIAMLSGWLPSAVASQFSPLSLFRFGKAGRSLTIKSSLLTVQYTVTIALIIALIVISRQIDFIKNKDLGFDSEQLIRLDVHWNLTDKLPIIKQELMKHPYIIDATASHGGPGQIYYWTSWQDARDAGWNSSIPCIHADADFFNVFDVPTIIGRTFKRDEKEKVYVINESAWKLVGWTALEGQKIKGNAVIGVVSDIHVENMHKAIGPTFFVYDPEFSYSWLSLRISPQDIPGTIRYIEKTWKSICPEFAFNYYFYDEWIDSMYKSEEQLSYAIRLFVIIAILIACLGTFGVAQFTTIRSTKEIGIRKVNGAATHEIIKLLNMNFIKWVGIAFCCAVPLSYLTMGLWLQNFAYRTQLSWWIFTLAGLISLGIALLTISWQTWRAAQRNPVEALRYE